jgi:hypothetical protein
VQRTALPPKTHTTLREDPDMTNPSVVTAAAMRRRRAASPGLHGGASSMLRLSRASEARLPSGAALSDWAERAAGMLDLTPMMVGPLSQPVRVTVREPDLPAHPQGLQA